MLALILLIPAPSIGVLANGTLAESDVAVYALIGLVIWMICKVSVSYTHLTLPTICSV